MLFCEAMPTDGVALRSWISLRAALALRRHSRLDVVSRERIRQPALINPAVNGAPAYTKKRGGFGSCDWLLVLVVHVLLVVLAGRRSCGRLSY